MSFVDSLILLGVFSFFGLLVWAKMEHKEVMEILSDIKELLVEMKEGQDD